MRCRHRLSKLLLRHGIRFEDGRAWTDRHHAWLAGTELGWPAAQATFADACGAADALVHRRDALEREIIAMLPASPWQAQVARLRCLRGIDTVSAAGLCAEIGDFERFARAEALMRSPRFANYFDDWEEPTYYADVETTRQRLAAAGFVDVEVSLEEAPTTFDAPDQFQEFIANVCMRHQVARLPNADRAAFLRELTVAAATDKPAFTLDYWRLNITGTRPA